MVLICGLRNNKFFSSSSLTPRWFVDHLCIYFWGGVFVVVKYMEYNGIICTTIGTTSDFLKLAELKRWREESV